MSKGKSQGKRQMCAVCIPEGSAGPASRSEIARSHPCAPTFCANSFRFTHFRKNASATPLVSHTFKTKDLKPFRFTHFQKKAGWTPCFPPDAHLQSPVYPEAGRVTNHKSLRLSPLISALTSKRAGKSFTCNTYEKHTQGEGGAQTAQLIQVRVRFLHPRNLAIFHWHNSSVLFLQVRRRASAMPTDRKPEFFKGSQLKVGIMGCGYVGLPLALRFAEAGHRVLGFDTDPDKVSKLNAGRSYIEHIPVAKIQQFVISKHFSATNDFARLKDMDAVIICVPTPLDERREPDLSYVQATVLSISPNLQKGQLVVLESTTYPGTT